MSNLKLCVTVLGRDNSSERPMEAGRLFSLYWDGALHLDKIRQVDLIPGASAQRSQGCRGLCLYNNKLYVASSDNVIRVYNPENLELDYSFEIPELKYVHQIITHGEFLLVTNTARDQLLWLYKDKVVRAEDLQKFSALLDPLCKEVSRITGEWSDHVWGEDKLHFNSLAIHPTTKEIYGLFMAANAVFNITQGELIFFDPYALHSVHDLEFYSPDWLLINSSSDQSTLALNLVTKQLRVVRKIETSSQNIVSGIHNNFTRGLAISENLVFLGSSPATITVFEVTTPPHGKVLEILRLSEDPFCSLYDIEVVSG